MLQALQTLVKHIARTEVMPYFLNAGANEKPDGSILTEADLAAQAAFAAALPQIADCPMLGEEMDDETQRDLWLHNHDGLWVVDPIDGTTNFANGFPHFALSAALMRRGKSVLGVVYDPVADECFAAEAGKGAFLNCRRLPLAVRGKKLHRAIAGVEIKYLRSGTLAGRMNTLSPVGSIRSMGSSTLDWCYLAAGRMDVYVHGGQKLWDYAAGALILAEAGGCIATLEGDDFWSGGHVFQRSAIAALNPELFAPWLAWIRANQ
ncbi:inositol monophosphatase family protein [Kingella potus]|uniref:inositol monophosphatase family protein n=1 Tax=Kingella potus TaxID=265175 RepID=UPI001FD2A942|nr:inositol monophosphatase family protein [Kingella potus]UOP00893.1 inositol monophosphatase family protein [Kingella potus]